VKLLGVLWGAGKYIAEGRVVAVPIPLSVDIYAEVDVPNNLGFCIKADKLLEFERRFLSMTAVI
jgi:hypothetical protein